jgi:hypothetical protein
VAAPIIFLSSPPLQSPLHGASNHALDHYKQQGTDCHAGFTKPLQ